MKKLLVLCLALLLCFTALVACKPDNPEPEVTYKLDKAVAYVKNLYNSEQIKPEGSDVAVATKYADFERVSQVPVAGVMYDITWTVSETDAAKVKVVQGSGATPTVIDVNEKTTEDISFTLTATVKAGDGTSDTITFNIFVPKYDVITYEEYRAKADGESATVEGIVVALNSKSAGNKRNHIFLMDAAGKGGYYAYDMADDPVKLGIEVGMTVAISGEVDIYSDMYELKSATARIINSVKKTPTAIDITTKFGAGENILEYVGALVTIKGVEIGKQELETATSQYLFFTLNGVESYIRTYITDLPTSFEVTTDAAGNTVCADKATIDAAHAEKFGWTANVTGVVIAYNGAPYLMPVSKDCFEYTQKIEKTADEKIDIELDALTMVEKLGADKVVELVTAGVNYKDVVMTWTSNSEYAVVAADGKSIAFTIPATETTVTITVTGTIGTTSDTRTFEVVLTPVTFKLTANTPYLFCFTDKDGVVKYLDGENAGGKDFRWNLTDDVTKAAAFYVEVVDGGYYVYFMKGEVKTYLNIVKSGTYINLLAGTEGKSVWIYDVALEALAVNVDGTLYVAKNYSGYGNVEAKSSDYKENEDTTYVLSLADVKFNFGFESNGTMQYLDGENVGGKNYRWNLTNDATKAATFYVEGNADGSYYIYFYKENVKTYFNIVKVGTFINLLAESEPNSKWVYNSELKAYVVEIDETLYMPKTYSGYGNVEAKAADYKKDEDTTFIISLFNVGYAPAATEPEKPEGGEGTEGGEGNEGTTTPATPITSAPVVGTQYVYAFADNSGKMMYLDGENAGGKDFRWNLTADATKAAVFCVEDAGDGAFYVYFMKAGAKTYFNIVKNDTYINLLAGATAESKWVYDATIGALVVDVEGTLYMPKNYGGYTNVEAKKSDYTNGDTYVLTFYVPGTGVGGGTEGGGSTEATGAAVSFADAANRTELTTEKQVWKQNGVTVTNEKGDSTSNVADYSAPARFYKNSKLTVAVEGKQITKIVFSVNSGKPVADFTAALTDSAAYTVTTDGNTVTVTFTAAVDAFTVTLSVGQVRMDAVTVYTA